MAALTGLLIGLAVAGTATQAVGQAKAAKAARKTGAIEGELYDQQARDAIQRGEEQAGQVASQARLLTGAQRASLAAQGIDISSGSASDVITSDQRRAGLVEDQYRLNAAREAFGFTEQGRLARLGAANAAGAYQHAMYSTLIGGAANLFDQYRSWGLNRSPRKTTRD